MVCTIHVVFGDNLDDRRDELKALATVMVCYYYYYYYYDHYYYYYYMLCLGIILMIGGMN